MNNEAHSGLSTRAIVERLKTETKAQDSRFGYQRSLRNLRMCCHILNLGHTHVVYTTEQTFCNMQSNVHWQYPDTEVWKDEYTVFGYLHSRTVTISGLAPAWKPWSMAWKDYFLRFLLCTFKGVQLTAVSVMYPKICFSLQIPKGEKEIIVLGWEEHSDAARSTTKSGELCGPGADNKQMAFAVAWMWSSLFVNYLFNDQCLFSLL